ncbi:MAG: porin family protein [Deltaproteobacteria bacterium]|nr:porin family protein [Deltaproteobacteria bacterium]
MRSHVLCVCAAAALIVASTPTAHADEPAPLPRVGVGVALPLSTGVAGTVYVPVHLHPRVRVEPGLGYAATTQDTKGKTITLKDSSSLVSLGLGVFYVLRPSDDAVIYVGPRAAVLLRSTVNEYTDFTTTSERTDFLLTLAVGGEHFLGKHFSLGIEAAIGRTWQGQPKVTDTPPSPYADPSTVSAEVSQSTTSTVGSLFGRFYF